MWKTFSAEKLPHLKGLQFFGKNFAPSTSAIFLLKQKTHRGGKGAVVVKFFAPLLGDRLSACRSRPEPNVSLLLFFLLDKIFRENQKLILNIFRINS